LTQPNVQAEELPKWDYSYTGAVVRTAKLVAIFAEHGEFTIEKIGKLCDGWGPQDSYWLLV
jgi:hypothetical protein